MKNNAIKLTLFMGAFISSTSYAQLFSGENDASRNIDLLEKQRMQEQVEEEKEQERRIYENNNQKDLLVEPNLSQSNVKFRIKKINIENDNLLNLSAQRNKIIESYVDTDMGYAEVIKLVTELTNFYIAKGYVTTQATIVPGSLKEGELNIRILWGSLLGFKKNGTEPDWREKIRLFSAMPFAENKPLTISGIDQALDNIMRVSPSDRLQIMPTDRTGMSEIDHISKSIIPISIHAGMNNSGYKESGWGQYYLSSSLKNAIGINDILNYYYSYNDLHNKKDKQSSKSISYSFPVGYWAADLSYYKSQYNKIISGLYNSGYKTDGSSERFSLKLSRVLYRNKSGKFTSYVKVEHRKNENNIMDTPISVSSKNYSSATAGLTWVGPLINGWGYSDLSITTGRPWFNSAWKNDPDLKGFDVNYNKINGVINWNKNIAEVIPGRLSIDYDLNGAFQYTNDQLVSDAKYSIGDEYTVRGFKESSVSAERAAWISNTIRMPITVNYATLYRVSPFIGVDFGMARKNCLSTSLCPKDYLSGAATGIKFNSKYFNGSFGAGWPMKKPKSLENSKVDHYTVYFNFDLGF